MQLLYDVTQNVNSQSTVEWLRLKDGKKACALLTNQIPSTLTEEGRRNQAGKSYFLGDWPLVAPFSKLVTWKSESWSLQIKSGFRFLTETYSVFDIPQNQTSAFDIPANSGKVILASKLKSN